jgi:hypothetical protein
MSRALAIHRGYTSLLLQGFEDFGQRFSARLSRAAVKLILPLQGDGRFLGAGSQGDTLGWIILAFQAARLRSRHLQTRPG